MFLASSRKMVISERSTLAKVKGLTGDIYSSVGNRLLLESLSEETVWSPYAYFCVRVLGSSQSRALTQPSSRVRGYHLRQRPSQKLPLFPKPWQKWRSGEYMSCRTHRGTWPDLVAELLQVRGWCCCEVGEPLLPGWRVRGECEEDCRQWRKRRWTRPPALGGFG